MFRTVPLLLAGLTLMSGCAPAALFYYGSRDATREVVTQVLTEQRPDLAAEPAMGCVIKGMTRGEVLSIGNNNVEAVTAADTAKVTEVLQRPEVVECLAALPQGATAP